MPSEPPRSRSARRKSRFDTNPSSETSASQLRASYCQTSPSDAGPPVVPSGSGRFTGRSAPRRRPYACDETIFLSGASSRAVTVSISATWRARALRERVREPAQRRVEVVRAERAELVRVEDAAVRAVRGEPDDRAVCEARDVDRDGERRVRAPRREGGLGGRRLRCSGPGASAEDDELPGRLEVRAQDVARGRDLRLGDVRPGRGQEHDDELLPGARDRRDGEEGGEEEGAHEASGHGAARVEVDFAGEADDVDVDGISGPGPGPARAGGGSAQRSTGATAHALAAGSSSHATLRSRGGRGTWTASG